MLKIEFPIKDLKGRNEKKEKERKIRIPDQRKVKRKNTAQTANKNRPLEDGNIDIFLSFFSLPVKGWLGI